MHTVNDRPGRLRSSLKIEIHSYYAIRLWRGNPQPHESGNKAIFSVMSMPYVLWRADIIQKHSLADNPWADGVMFKVEELLNKAEKRINIRIKELEGILKSVPPGISFSDIESHAPLNIGVYCNSPLGFRCVWILVGYDKMVLKVFQASRFGLISRSRRDQLLRECSGLIRKIYGAIRPYQTIKVTRADLAKLAPAAKAAIRKMGALDPDIVTGIKRSSFSPPLKN